MPLFAFLEPIWKFDDENNVKTRFSACGTFATAAYAFICVLRTDLKSWWWKQWKTRFSAGLTFATAAYAYIYVSRGDFESR